ncbi:MAG: methylmalonyl-CoA epimerase [Chloroflexi bacterium]|jgi:methylmalonyl-CoA epimerase|nr:MAG: methylmalonyl-CoA epimerase [Chloroflexota bacterium]
MIAKINHVGIAVSSIEDALVLYADALGLTVGTFEVVEDQKTRTAIIPVGDSKIELLEATDSESPIARHIERRGEGLHHLAFEVDDIDDALKLLQEKGIRLIDEQPRKGVENSTIAFLHPKATGGVLLELVQG